MGMHFIRWCKIVPIIFYVIFHHFNNPVFCLTVLLSCPDFQDMRKDTPRNDNDSGSEKNRTRTPYQIIDPGYNVLASCSETFSRFVNVAGNGSQIFPPDEFDPNSPFIRIWDSRSSEKFTLRGHYYDGFHYFQRSEYCVKSTWDFGLELRICQPTCNSISSGSGARHCIPKCCAPDEILDYWSLTCLELQKGEPEWHPVVCERETCRPMNAFHDIHFHRHSFSCGRSLFRQSTSTVGILLDGEHRVDEKQNIRMDVTDGTVTLQRLAEERVWKRYDENFCADGFIKSGDDNYTGTPEHQVFLTCTTQQLMSEGVPRVINNHAIISAYIIGIICLLITVIIYLSLLCQQKFNGLVILSYSISSLFTYVLHLFVEFTSVFPNSELWGKDVRAPFCMILAIGSHYLIFVDHCWLTVMNLSLWLTVRSTRPVNSASRRIKTFIVYSILAWGIPALLVGSFVVVDEVYRDPLTFVIVPDYGIKACYVASWSRGYYMYSPIACFVLVNGILICLTFKVLVGARTNASKMIKTGADKYTPKLFLKLFCLMGVISFLQLASWYFNGKVKPWYLYVVEFILVGEPIVLFILFCCNERIMKQLQDKFPPLKGFFAFLVRMKASLIPTSSCCEGILRTQDSVTASTST